METQEQINAKLEEYINKNNGQVLLAETQLKNYVIFLSAFFALSPAAAGMLAGKYL